MYSGKEPQGQSEIPEGHCIKEGKLFQIIKFLSKSLRFFIWVIYNLWTTEFIDMKKRIKSV